jgi:hypothetical protein
MKHTKIPRRASESWTVKLLGQRFRFRDHDEYVSFHIRYAVGRYPTGAKLAAFLDEIKDLRNKGLLILDDTDSLKVPTK